MARRAKLRLSGNTTINSFRIHSQWKFGRKNFIERSFISTEHYLEHYLLSAFLLRTGWFTK
jgi:hypothetical protein